MNNLVIIFVCALFAACSTPKTNTSQAAPTNDTKITAGTQNGLPEINSASSSSVDSANDASRVAGDDQHSMAAQSVYFDYDKFSVKPEYRETLIQEANLLKNHNNVIVTLEGNADERGSAAYNLALGDERARAVRKHLELLGIPASQIKVISYGNERPKLDCHEEKCWHENRRVDFVQQHG